MITGPVYLVEARFFEIAARVTRDPSSRNVGDLAKAIDQFAQLQRRFEKDAAPSESRCERCGHVQLP